MLRVSFLLLFVLVLSGCSRTRQFLHMDSNSSSPFFGLELSVDAGKNECTKFVNADSANVATIRARETQIQSADSAAVANSRYSLPQLDLSKNPEDAEEVYDLIEQLSI